MAVGEISPSHASGTRTVPPGAPSSNEQLETGVSGWDWRVVFALCFSISILDGYDLQVLAIAAPGMRAQLGLAPAALGVALGAGLVGLAFGG